MSAELLGQAILRMNSKPASIVDFGFATVAPGSALASVAGIAVDPVQIDRSNWSSEFVALAAAGVTNRRVLVLFVAGQPTILTAMGV